MIEQSRRTLTNTVFWSLLVTLFLLASLVVATESALHFSGVPIDGPFQLYDAMRRIAAGYRPGIDFQFFHGLGVPYIYYWLFRLFGAGLRGSELARNLVSPIVYALVLLAFFRTFVGNWRRTLCATTIVFALTFTIRISGAFFALVFAINGMLGVRAAMPILLPVVLYRVRSRAGRVIGGGVVLGLSLFFGSEQGLAAVLAFAVVSCIAVARRRDRVEQAIDVASTLAVGAVMLVCALTAVAGWTGMRGALHYNFSIIPADQYWFFGAPPNAFVPSWSALPRMLARSWQIGLASLFGVVSSAIYLRRFWRAPEGEPGRRHFALAVLPVYGITSLASLLGVFTPVYSQPCWRTLSLIAVVEWFAYADRRAKQASTNDLFGVPRLVGMTAVVLALVSFTTVSLVRTALSGSLSHVLREHVFGHARFEAGGIWPVTLAEGQAFIDSRHNADGSPPSIWSTYSGWIEARNGEFNPSFDYMIHALGPDNRRAYVAKFRDSKPRLAQTVLPTFTQYEPWLENTNWLFYDELLRWYDVAAVTPWSLYWERRQSSAAEPQQLGAMQVPSGLTTIPLPPIPAASPPSSSLTLLEVEVDYTISNPLGWLPIIGKSPRYLVGIGGALSHVPVSLDPLVTTTRFPLVLRSGQQPTLYFQTASLLPGASFTPRAIRLYARAVSAKNQAWLADLANRLAQ